MSHEAKGSPVKKVMADILINRWSKEANEGVHVREHKVPSAVIPRHDFILGSDESIIAHLLSIDDSVAGAQEGWFVIAEMFKLTN